MKITENMIEAAAKQIAVGAGDSSEDWKRHTLTAKLALEAALKAKKDAE